MKNNILQIPLILLLVFVGTSVFAQKNKTEAADKAFNSGSYYEAINLYTAAYNSERSAAKKKLIVYRIGYSHYRLEDYKNAKTWLGRAIKAGYSNPEGQYYYAKTIRRMGDYDQAIVEFRKYKELAPEDKRADQYIAECEMAQEWIDNPTRYIVEKDPVLNSKQADFSPSWGDKRHTSLFFTSTREGSVGNNVDPITGQSFSSMWYTKQDKKSKKWMVPDIVGEGVINNGEANEGAGSMDSRYTTIYLTRCMVVKKTNKGCAIYTSKKMGPQNWSETKLLDLTGNDTSVAGHPSIGLKDEYLFFASDMPGGQGGKDIWFVKYDKRKKAWSDPINMGPTINTPEDEMYPYIHADGRLFFASNGHPGMGALDIFVATRKGTTDEWENVENMKYPINSSYNDFGILFDGTKNRGYLSSDRPGGRGSDDIWSFRVPPLKFILAGTVTDVDEGTPISGVTIQLIGTDGSNVEAKTDELGYYEFDQIPGGNDRYIKEETSYTLVVNKDEYLAGKGQETTVGLMQSTKIVHDFKLQSIKVAAISFPEVRYDLAKAELQVNDSVNSKDSLDYLYNTLIDNPTIVIELMAHTDSRGGDKANMKLSQARAQSCVDYLVSKGIPEDRMVAKGYGETQPRFTDAQINALPSKAEKEAAHQKNRRTEFRVLRDDYVAAPAQEPAPEGDGGESGN